MRTTTRSLLPRLALAAALGLALSGCSGGGDGGDGGPADDASPSSSSEATSEEPTEGSEDEPSESSSDDATTEEEPDAGTSEPVDVSDQGLEDRHQNGSVLTVRSVQVDRTGIIVGVTVVNGFTETISLASVGSMFLVDDQGNGYLFREPAQNADLAVEPGAELNGELVFLGVLPDDATSLTLKTNVYNFDDTIDTASRYDQSRSPEFLVEGIPVG